MRRFVLSLALMATVASAALAGPITPPPGPVSPTPGPEPRIAINATNTPGDADSLFKISQPGSYYLTENITGVAGKHGIEIAANGVTVDLMGFDLAGTPGMGAFDGVSATVFGLRNINIRNGSVRGWGDEGVDLSTLGVDNSSVIDVRACGNSSNGISGGTGGMITGCTAFQNTGNGILTSNGCTITGCTAFQNTGNGISTSDGCTITGCTAYTNVASGISTSSGCTITGCTAYSNSVNGILTSSGCTITGCTAYFNFGSGISAFNRCAITNCSASSNRSDGIRVAGRCLVLANTCSDNGNNTIDGAGVHATSSNNRVEGNNCTNNDYGIDIDSAGNIIIRNTCSTNVVNWDIVANNVCGPILDRTAPASAAISGNSAPDSTGSTHPNANFSY